MRLPEPDFVRPVAEVLSAIVEAIVRPPEVLFWITMRSAPEAPRSVPPVIVLVFAPTALVTRMPPEVIVFAPASVTELAPAALNRRLLVVAPLDGDELVVTVVLLPEVQVSLA